MTQREKLVLRLLSVPADFEWDELVRVLSYFGYLEVTKSGSHRRFVHKDTGVVIMGLVKPHHPNKHVRRGYLHKVIQMLGL